MIELDDKLIKKFHQQKDGVYARDEEQRLCLAAQAYSICENSIAVFSNLRTDKSYIFFGKSCEALGLGNQIQYRRLIPYGKKKFSVGFILMTGRSVACKNLPFSA